MFTLYAIGSNGSGQLGIGHKEDVSVPKEVLFDPCKPAIGQDPPQIRAGGNHTLLLSAGELYCAGDASTGACGLIPETTKPHPHFRKVVLDTEDTSRTEQPNIILCAATWEASFIVKKDAQGRATKLYSFGTGSKGELGLGELIFRSPKAQLIKDFPPSNTEIVNLAASVSHIVAFLSNGDVYGWGNGRKGQLGQPEGIISSPRKILGVDFKVAQAVCGREFTYMLSKPEDGEHIILGVDKWNIRSSATISIKDWEEIGAGWSNLFVLLRDRKLLSWGRDDHGQLAPPNLPELSHISVGSEHVLGLTPPGDVLAWGWGEHGNCGPGTVEGDVKGGWNVIASPKHLPPEMEIIAIGSGCATSWIFVRS